MENQGTTSQDYKLSWVAYIRSLVIFGLILLAGLVISGLLAQQWLAGVAVALSTIWLVCRVMYMRSVRIYVDDAGVWVYRGVFPWQKGIYGVKWRDVDGALYGGGFISWACRSYAVHVGHRYTKSSEINMRHVQRGNQFVECVNKEHQKRIS